MLCHCIKVETLNWLAKIVKRGITLGSCVAKVFTRVLTRQLGEYAEERILTEAQGGFRAKRSCSDQILILSGVCKLSRREEEHTWPFLM